MSTQENRQSQEILARAHREYEQLLQKRAYFKVNDRMLAEDLVQTTFLKTWNYLLKGGKIDKMKAFLYHILNNLIVDEYRKNKPVSLDLLLEKGYEPTALDESYRMADKLDGKKAVKLIRRLPKKYQKVVKMRYIDDLSLEEMSLKTGQSRNTVAVQAHRGIESLKSLYIQAQI